MTDRPSLDGVYDDSQPSETRALDAISVLRNPWGRSEDEVRAARLFAADFIEYALTPIDTRWERNGCFAVDTATKRAYLGDTLLTLKPKEYDLMLFFVRNAGKMMSVREILRQVWGAAQAAEPTIYAQYVRVYVGTLRKKIGQDAIKSQLGHGYIMERAV